MAASLFIYETLPVTRPLAGTPAASRHRWAVAFERVALGQPIPEARSALLRRDARGVRGAPLARSLPLPNYRLIASPCRREAAKGADRTRFKSSRPKP